MHINPKLYTKCPLGERDKITTWIIKIWRQINLLWKVMKSQDMTRDSYLKFLWETVDHTKNEQLQLI
jgi:hypothetical protein